MPPLSLEGNTLGKKHERFNSKLNEAIKNATPLESVGSEYGESVVGQLLKIEVANRRRDVEYVLQTLKSSDMVVVSRAIRGGGWLVLDDQYSHIVEPHFLHDQLLPHMTTRATCKFMLHVRLTLRDERRVESFFKYYENKDLDKALKWLSNCSSEFIIDAVKKHAFKDKIKTNLFKKLCEKCPAVFEIFFKNVVCFKKIYLESVMFFLKTNPHKFLDVCETTELYDTYARPSFDKRHTKIIMDRCPERILNKFYFYAYNVHVLTVVKYIKPENVKQYLMNISNDENLQFWFTYKNIKPFIQVMPKEGKFDFLKRTFIDSVADIQNPDTFALGECLRLGVNPTGIHNVYQWYRHAPFNIALPDLKELINLESSPNERGAIFRVLLSCAGRDFANIHTVLEYYHDKHINEPFKYKINFLNAVISVTKTHRFNDKTWIILNELFHSCEVYVESSNNVQNCLEAIIIRSIVKDLSLPKIVEEKFKFNSLKKFQKNLKDFEKDNVFKYLYTLLETRMLNDVKDVKKSVSLLENMLDLLIDWKKQLKQFPFVINKIKKTIEKNMNEKFNINMENIYNKNKSWRIHMFEESFLICNQEKVYINALKHDPCIFNRHKTAIEALHFDDKLNLTRLYSKLKIYWADTLAKDWAASYHKHLHESNGHVVNVRALCALMPRQELFKLFDEFAPDLHSKIVWSEIDNNILSLRKSIASQMHRTQPQPPPTYILKYAHGDYLQYAMSSLCSIYNNLSTPKSSEYLPLLIKSSVSLQKVGIRVASYKLDAGELRDVLINIWKASKNAIIRAVIFKSTFKRLSSEHNKSKADILWGMMEAFMNDLSTEENQACYTLLGNVEEIPISYRSKFCVKAYCILKKLPTKANCHKILNSVIDAASKLIETFDEDFAADIYLDYINTWLDTKKILINNHKRQQNFIIKYISNYILCCKSKEVQNTRLEKVVTRWLQQVFSLWNVTVSNEYIIENYFRTCLRSWVMTSADNVIKRKDYVIPIEAFKFIKDKLETSLPLDRHYEHFLQLKFAISYSLCCDKVRNNIKSDLPQYIDIEHNELVLNETQKELWVKIAPLFATDCIKMLREEKLNNFDSIHPIFAHCLSEFIPAVRGYQVICYDFEKELARNRGTDIQLLAIDILPKKYYDAENVKLLNEVRNIILENPSKEVRLRYNSKYSDNPI